MLEKTWRFINPQFKIMINRVSNLFSTDNVKQEGRELKGKISFYATKNVDEFWGPEAKVELSWETVDPINFHQGRRVKETIRMFSSIDVIATKKLTKWHLSHEMTYWYGTRQQIMHKRFYPSQIIHAVWYCELTKRVFEIHAICLTNYFKNYEQAILDLIFSTQCHAS